MDLNQAQQQLLSRLNTIYDPREASTMVDRVMEKITGWKKIDRILHKNTPLTGTGLELLKKYTAELLTHRPLQYVLQESWFCGMKLYVDEHVLIPRPETEELVDWVVSGDQAQDDGDKISCSMLDVGTGSGCIAIALKKKLSQIKSFVHACDISAEALAIARLNAASHDADIHFQQVDFLDSRQWKNLPAVNFLVSNPPYIPLKEKNTMAPNVIGFEPHLALFVEDHDPLIFYKAIAGFAQEKLLPGGEIFVEIHEELSGAVMQLFREAGFPAITLKKDMQDKDRMIKATR